MTSEKQQALPASTAEQAAAKRRVVRAAAKHANELYGEDPNVPAKWLDVFTYCYEELVGAPVSREPQADA